MLIPVLVLAFRAIARHYRQVRAAVSVDTTYKPIRRTHLVVVLVGSVHRGVLEAIQYARSLAPERLLAVSVVTDQDEQDQLVQDWADHEIPVPLHTIAPRTGRSPVLSSSTSTSSTPRAPTT